MTNKPKSWAWLLGVPASILALWFLLSVPIESGAEKVYDAKKPEMIEIVNTKIQTHELRIEPRLQAIEHEQTESKKRDGEMMLIQREILTEVKK